MNNVKYLVLFVSSSQRVSYDNNYFIKLFHFTFALRQFSTVRGNKFIENIRCTLRDVRDFYTHNCKKIQTL